MEELKPCPFCGGVAIIAGDTRAYIKCSTCGVRGMSFKHYRGDANSRATAITLATKAWNQRTETGV
jgi:Lar family restriction alleviation protein